MNFSKNVFIVFYCVLDIYKLTKESSSHDISFSLCKMNNISELAVRKCPDCKYKITWEHKGITQKVKLEMTFEYVIKCE